MVSRASVSHPMVSVLMVQWGETELTRRALEAVRRSTYDGTVELLVWDNDSPDGPGPVAAMDDISLVAAAENVGFGPANDALAERAEGDLLLLLNNDTILAPDSLRCLVDCLQADPEAVAVVPQLRGFDGRLQELGSFVANSGEAWQLLRGERAPRSLLERPFSAHYGSAACLLLRRRDFLAVGGFDDAFAPAYYEDTDLCMRLTADGGRVVVEPRAVVYHLEGGTAGCDTSADGAKRLQLRNRGRFAARWSSRLAGVESIDQGVALRRALQPRDDGSLVLWILPEFLKADQSGGHARILKQLEVLREAGMGLAVWSEHVGDQGRYKADLDRLGVFWSGHREPLRWLPQEREGNRFRSLNQLLEFDIWDAVVAWSADVAHRFGPLVRQLRPDTPYLVDSTILHYLQCLRGVGVGAAQMDDLQAEKGWELEVYGEADALVAASAYEASVLRDELPHLDVFAFDVGAYEPLATGPLDERRSGPLVFLGSFIHPPNLDAVVWWVEEIHPLVEKRLGRPQPLRVVGASSELVADVVGPTPAVEIVGWVEDLADELCRARALLVPLRYGAGTKDKIAMGMRFGLPTITSTVGAESMPEDLTSVLTLGDDADQLAAHVVRLMGDDGLWAKKATDTHLAAQAAWEAQLEVQRRYVRWFSKWCGRSLK